MISTENTAAFAAARRRVLAEESLSEGFTVYAERAIHKTVKLYIDPDPEHHECELLGSVADVFNENGVFEVQTASFIPLIPKIEKLLTTYRVTLVHPISVRTVHKWLDRGSGEIITPKHKGRAAGIHSVAFELFKIRRFIGHPNFSVRLILIECEEFRALDGWDKTKKRGATIIEKLPTALVDDLLLKEKRDYLAFLPDTLGETFTAKEYVSKTGCRSRYAPYGVKLLLELGLVELVGKRGRAYLYKRTVSISEK